MSLLNGLVRGFAGLAALALTTAAQADSYPSKNVRVLVPFAAAGPTDIIARLIGQRLADMHGHAYTIENVPGAGGNTGTAQAARSPADGYTLLVISTGFMVNPSLYARIPYDPIKDFAPVTLIAASPNVLTINPEVPAKTVKELIAVIKANPGKYSYAQPALGSTPHLGGELFRLTFSLDLTMVPFPGAGPAITSTIGGHTPIAFTALPPAIAPAKDGKLRALAVMAEKRVSALPDVPTMAEAGVPDQEADTLTGIVAPAGTPKEIVDQLQRDIAKIVAEPDVKEKLDTLGFRPVANTPEQFGVQIKAEMDKWGKVVHAAKLHID
jgi:tripartite-type tricarboxylate transporter receptor subunit TctC